MFWWASFRKCRLCIYIYPYAHPSQLSRWLPWMTLFWFWSIHGLLLSFSLPSRILCLRLAAGLHCFPSNSRRFCCVVLYYRRCCCFLNFQTCFRIFLHFSIFSLLSALFFRFGASLSLNSMFTFRLDLHMFAKCAHSVPLFVFQGVEAGHRCAQRLCMCIFPIIMLLLLQLF